MSPAEQILGTWQTGIGGMQFDITYTEVDVAVAGHTAVAYQLDGNRLTLLGDMTTAKIVSFPNANEMVQEDTITGTTQHYGRVDTASR